jgi:hypothetical protein
LLILRSLKHYKIHITIKLYFLVLAHVEGCDIHYIYIFFNFRHFRRRVLFIEEVKSLSVEKRRLPL